MRRIRLVNDCLLLNLGGTINLCRRRQSNNNRVETDPEAARSFIFLGLLYKKLDFFLNIPAGVQDVVAAIAAGVDVGHISQIYVVLTIFLIKIESIWGL